MLLSSPITVIVNIRWLPRSVFVFNSRAAFTQDVMSSLSLVLYFTCCGSNSVVYFIALSKMFKLWGFPAATSTFWLYFGINNYKNQLILLISYCCWFHLLLFIISTTLCQWKTWTSPIMKKLNDCSTIRGYFNVNMFF